MQVADSVSSQLGTQSIEKWLSSHPNDKYLNIDGVDVLVREDARPETSVYASSFSLEVLASSLYALNQSVHMCFQKQQEEARKICMNELAERIHQIRKECNTLPYFSGCMCAMEELLYKNVDRSPFGFDKCSCGTKRSTLVLQRERVSSYVSKKEGKVMCSLTVKESPHGKLNGVQLYQSALDFRDASDACVTELFQMAVKKYNTEDDLLSQLGVSSINEWKSQHPQDSYQNINGINVIVREGVQAETGVYASSCSLEIIASPACAFNRMQCGCFNVQQEDGRKMCFDQLTELVRKRLCQ